MSGNEEQSPVVDDYLLIARPSSCSLRIERAGIRILKDIVLTQYILHAQSGITYTWVKEGDRWTLLGGMSYDLPADEKP